MSVPVVKKSQYTYNETISRLAAAISTTGNRLFTVIDQADAAHAVGLALRPTALIIFGNPKGGTPLMEAFPLAALALPLKLVVWEENGVTRVAHSRMADALADAGVPADDPRIAALDNALDSLSDSVR
jgi:uncharacterized protein (DUF302 family)